MQRRRRRLQPRCESDIATRNNNNKKKHYEGNATDWVAYAELHELMLDVENIQYNVLVKALLQYLFCACSFWCCRSLILGVANLSGTE